MSNNGKTIKQIADEIGVSKQAVAYQLRKLEATKLNGVLAVKLNGVLVVSLAGETLIKQALVKNDRQNFGAKEPPKLNTSFNTSFDSEIIRMLQDNITLLQEQLKVKDEQLAAAQEALKAEQLLHADTKKMYLLDSHGGGSQLERNPTPIGFWKRLFGRNER